jgi:hypothetical protein
MKKMIYRLLLSSGQLEFLSDSRSGIDRMKCLSTLIEMAAVKESVYETRGFSTVIYVGQAAVSEVALASLWKCNRKTVSKVLCRFNQMGLVSSEKGNRTSVHTILCVDTFFVDGKPVRNGYCRGLPAVNVGSQKAAVHPQPKPSSKSTESSGEKREIANLDINDLLSEARAEGEAVRDSMDDLQL